MVALVVGVVVVVVVVPDLVAVVVAVVVQDLDLMIVAVDLADNHFQDIVVVVVVEVVVDTLVDLVVLDMLIDPVVHLVVDHNQDLVQDLVNHNYHSPLVVVVVDHHQHFVVVHIDQVLDYQPVDHTFAVGHLVVQVVVVDNPLVMGLDVEVYLDNHRHQVVDLLMLLVAYDDNLVVHRHLLDNLVVVDHMP